jgi:hypothetical protein
MNTSLPQFNAQDLKLINKCRGLHNRLGLPSN